MTGYHLQRTLQSLAYALRERLVRPMFNPPMPPEQAVHIRYLQADMPAEDEDLFISHFPLSGTLSGSGMLIVPLRVHTLAKILYTAGSRPKRGTSVGTEHSLYSSELEPGGTCLLPSSSVPPTTFPPPHPVYRTMLFSFSRPLHPENSLSGPTIGHCGLTH